MTERIFKESHRGRTIKYFMTTDHHLKSFLWFHMNHQNIPGILHQCTNSISQLSLYSTLKMSLRNPWPSLGFGKWGHCTQLHLEVRSGSVFVPWVPGQPWWRLRATSLFQTREGHHWDRFLALDHQHFYGSTNLTHSFINKWRRFPLLFPTVFFFF